MIAVQVGLKREYDGLLLYFCALRRTYSSSSLPCVPQMHLFGIHRTKNERVKAKIVARKPENPRPMKSNV
jgi:hypothetical protein